MATVTPDRERIVLSSGRGRWLIAATAMGSGMIFLDGTVVNVALPRIQTDLGASLSGLQWIVNAYTLFLAALLLSGGGLGDTYGRRKAFVAGLIVFTVASVGCGLAPNLGFLIAARSVQGLGGALMVPASLAMIQAVMKPEDTGRAIGLWAGLSGVTSAVGPLLGGYLVGAVTWRAIFFINVPVAALTLYATARHVPPNRDEQATRTLDWPGALFTVIGLGGLTFAMIQGPVAGWATPAVLSALILGLAGVAAFPVRELLARHPMVPLGIFRSRNFSGANLATIGVYFSLSGALLFVVLDLQQLQGYSPLQAGAALLPLTLLLLVLSPRMGGLMNRFGVRLPLIGGPVVVAVAFLLFMRIGLRSSYLSDILPAVIMLGVGMAIFITPLTATVMSSVPEQMAGIASGVSNTITRIASLLAIAVLGIVVLAGFDSTLNGHMNGLSIGNSARASLIAHIDRLASDPMPTGLSRQQQAGVRGAIHDAYVNGFRWAMATCAALCLLSAIIAAITIRDTRREPVPAG